MAPPVPPAPVTTRRACARLITGAVTALIVLVIVSVYAGSHDLTPDQVLRALVAPDPGSQAAVLIRQIRVPRTLLAVLCGAALGAAGAVMQAMTRNPLAEPGLLGINAGATAGAVTRMILLGGRGHGSFPLMAAAGAGAATGALIVLGLGYGRSRRGPDPADGPDPVRLVLAGAALSAVLGSYTSLALINWPQVFTTFRHWGSGSLQGASWPAVAPTVAALAAGLAGALACARSLDALSSGDEAGRALGVSVRSTTILAVVSVACLAGGATAAIGPVAFAGLAAPLAVRQFTGPSLVRGLVPAALVAAVMVLAADIIARRIVAPRELPVAVVAALVGAPIFLAVVRSGAVTRR